MADARIVVSTRAEYSRVGHAAAAGEGNTGSRNSASSLSSFAWEATESMFPRA
jgi:hypothetical protein